MALKTYNPTSPARRNKIGINYRKVLTSTNPFKPLTYGLHKRWGRNNDGKITVRHKGGGNKKLYRTIDFKRDKLNVPGRIETIEYDPFRSAFICLVVYVDGEKRYILAPEGIQKNDTILSAENTELKIGNCLALKNINPGIPIHNIQMNPKSPGTLVRSAGSSAAVAGFDGKYAIIKMPSGETRKILSECYATIGQASNADHKNIKIAKAGVNRHRGIRPTVRGKAMNPREHPYGGKFNQPRGTRRPKDMWGNITGGRRTRDRNKPSHRFILQRRRK